MSSDDVEIRMLTCCLSNLKTFSYYILMFSLSCTYVYKIYMHMYIYMYIQPDIKVILKTSIDSILMYNEA